MAVTPPRPASSRGTHEDLAPKFDVAVDWPGRRTAVIAVRGEVHLTTAPELREHIDATISRGATAIVIDLTDVQFVDSTGLSVFLAALRMLRPKDGALALVVTNPTVLRLFEITRTDATFEIVATRDEALARVGA